jgi:hypothetical protein
VGVFEPLQIPFHREVTSIGLMWWHEGLETVSLIEAMRLLEGIGGLEPHCPVAQFSTAFDCVVEKALSPALSAQFFREIHFPQLAEIITSPMNGDRPDDSPVVALYYVEAASVPTVVGGNIGKVGVGSLGRWLKAVVAKNSENQGLDNLTISARRRSQRH